VIKEASIAVLAAALFLGLPEGRAAGTPTPPASLDALKDRLFGHIDQISVRIGERNTRHPEGLERAAAYITENFEASGYAVRHQDYTAAGKTVRNIEATLPGAEPGGKIIVVGAHYDSALGPAANDNASGVAALLELARLMKDATPRLTVRFVAFVNEEPPFFQTEEMGSYVYAREAKARGDDVAAMLSLETMGYYSDEKGSQRYPFPLKYLYPDTGNFIGFVGNRESRGLVKETLRLFRAASDMPAESAALPASIPGVGWSDHWSFWRFGYPALMVTDTAPFRYPYYHTEDDTIDKIDFYRLARVVDGLAGVIGSLAQGDQPHSRL
jgi:hypothetical protein